MTTLVLGPSLGTSAATCWGPTIAALGDEFDVVAWELPGHGTDQTVVESPLTMHDLAQRVLDGVDGPFIYGGDSVGGAVGLQLLLDAPDRVLGAVLCCTGARIGTADGWRERRDQVTKSGTASLVVPSAQRWFAPGFLEREPGRGSALLHALRDTDPAGYAAVCDALATFDVTDRLHEIRTPVIAVAGQADSVCPPASLRTIADGVPHGELVVLENVAHIAPAEAPEAVASLIRTLAKEIR